LYLDQDPKGSRLTRSEGMTKVRRPSPWRPDIRMKAIARKDRIDLPGEPPAADEHPKPPTLRNRSVLPHVSKAWVAQAQPSKETKRNEP